MWKYKITFCTEIREKQENSAHTSSVTNPKQTQKHCPWKTALARHQNSNMIVFITKGHKISKHSSCKPQKHEGKYFSASPIKI